MQQTFQAHTLSICKVTILVELLVFIIHNVNLRQIKKLIGTKSTQILVRVQVSTCFPATNFNTVVSIFVGNCSGLQCVDYNSGGCGNTFGTYLNFTATLPFYYVVVSGYNGYVGSYGLQVSEIYPSTCDRATNIFVGTSIYSLIGAPNVTSDPCGVISGHRTTWFLIQNITQGEHLTVSTCSTYTNFDTIIAIYTGSCSNLLCVAYNDDTTCPVTGVTTTSQVSFVPESGNIYYVAVSGYNTATGDFQLNVFVPQSSS